MFYAGNTQKTLIKPIKISGVGLHTNENITLNLRPAAIGTGIVFKRVDLPLLEALIYTKYHNVTETRLGTVISNEFGHKISTIEHLMAAIYANGITNMIIECDGNEIPVMDGSSDAFMVAIRSAGIKKLGAPKQYIQINKTVKVVEDDKFAVLSPFDGFKMKFEIEFSSQLIGYQCYEHEFSTSFFLNELSRARTFGFAEEVEALQKMGYARGGSLDNAVVIKNNKVLNKSGLRHDNEFVRHKMLDAVGDLALSGAPILGYYHGYKSGHGLNNQLLRELFSDANNYSIVTAPMTSKVVRHSTLQRATA